MKTLKKVTPPDFDSLLSNMVDRRRDAVYDRIRVPAGYELPPVFRCFGVPVGKPDLYLSSHIKDFRDTNMWTASQFNPPHELIAERVLFLFQPSVTESDRNAFLAAYTWRFQILEKSFAAQPVLVNVAEGKPEMLMENWGKGTWLNDEGDRADDSTSRISRIGVGVCWDMGDFKKYIPSLVNFAIVIEGSPFHVQGDLDMYVFLDGLRDYPVQ